MPENKLVMPDLRTIVFIDGQNLYHGAKDAWLTPSEWAKVPASHYTWPSYGVENLSIDLVSKIAGRVLSEIHFYTGVPDPHRSPTDRLWHGFWSNKLRYLRSKGIYTYAGRVSANGQEKGVDVSLAIDLVKLTYEKAYEVAIIISQDSDIGPAVKLAKEIARDQGRRLTFESAFPYGPGTHSRRGVPGTIWICIDQATYDSWYDPTDYRPAPSH